MARFGLKSIFALAVALGVACVAPAITIAQAQGSRDPQPHNLNDPQPRNLNDSAVRFQEQGRPLKDPADTRSTNAPGTTGSQDKKDIK